MLRLRYIPDIIGITYGVAAAQPGTDPGATMLNNIVLSLIPGVSEAASDEIVKALAGVGITVLSKILFHYLKKYKINGSEKESSETQNSEESN